MTVAAALDCTGIHAGYNKVAVARDIDPTYAAAFDRARKAGVEMLAWRCNVNLSGIEIAAPVPIVDG